MRILHINDIAYVGSTLVAGLQQRGHDAKLRRLELRAKRRATPVKLLALPLRLQELAAVNRQVKQGNYDIVHIHFAYLGWLGIVGRYPYILHCHGSDVRRDLHDRLRRPFILQSLARAQTVLFSTPDQAAIVQPVRPDAIYLPNPVDTERFYPVARAQDRSLRVLIISELSPVKAVDIAFAAVQQVQIRHPEIEVIAIDHGTERTRYHGTPGVTFIQPVANAEMPALIQSCDIVVGQFGIGSLGRAELESMACGKPVVGYFAQNMAQPEPPPLFSTPQPIQAAENLNALVEDPILRRSYGEQGRAWVHKHHGLMPVVQRLEQIYQQSKECKDRAERG